MLPKETGPDYNNVRWHPESQTWVVVVLGKHVPECNPQCDGDSHFLMPDEPRIVL